MSSGFLLINSDWKLKKLSRFLLKCKYPNTKIIFASLIKKFLPTLSIARNVQNFRIFHDNKIDGPILTLTLKITFDFTLTLKRDGARTFIFTLLIQCSVVTLQGLLPNVFQNSIIPRKATFTKNNNHPQLRRVYSETPSILNYWKHLLANWLSLLCFQAKFEENVDVTGVQ